MPDIGVTIPALQETFGPACCLKAGRALPNPHAARRSRTQSGVNHPNPRTMANILSFLIVASTFGAIVGSFGTAPQPYAYHQLDK